MRSLLPRSAFGRNVLTLATGTALAQAIPVLASPILTRLFEPAAFGVLALYLAFTAVGGVVATGRYELAILLPDDDGEARDLLLTSLLLALASGIGVLLAIAVATAFPWLVGERVIPRWLLAVPAGIVMVATVQSLGYWLNRRARYRQLAESRIVQSATMFGAQSGVGVLSGAGGVLIGGHLAGLGAATAVLVRSIMGADRALLRGASWRSIRAAARKHRRFPSFIAPGHLANAASSQLPTVLLAFYFGAAAAGLYALAERVLVLPSMLIGNSIGEVYRQEAAATYQRDGNCRELFLRTARRLALLGVLPCAVVVAFGAPLFAFAFGAEWREAGALASILAGMVYFQIISSPLSQTVLLADLHRQELVWQVARVVVAAAAIVVGHGVFDSVRVSVALYAGGFAVLHLVHSGLQYLAASGYRPLAARVSFSP